MSFKIGDRVIIRPRTRYYYDSCVSNPRNTEGTVIELRRDNTLLPIRVRWANNRTNVYHEDDLVLVEDRDSPRTTFVSFLRRVS